jgi:asparagine synthase (glutamine-hydrolysing)
VDEATLVRMTDSMTHRGPNDRGTHSADGVALGVRRLSIVDVDGGHQPLSNEDGSIWAIQNGELFNHRDLRERLEAEGHHFRTQCDTEAIPHLYERYGSTFASHLRGMFGIALWDGRRRRALIVRDRLGIKPLYYALADDKLVFGSELKSVLASGLVSPDLNYEAVDSYLTLGFFPAPHTPLAGVSKLPPGHQIVVEGGKVEIERYWKYPRPAPGDSSVQQYAGELLELLDESVRLRLMSDVPLGAMLSGGLDSSLIVALMARHMSEPVKTFSVGFAESPESNELADARAVAGEFGTEHHELQLSLQDFGVDLEQLVWHLDEPVADLSSLGFLALSRLASQHVTVALTGQGADELFGGYTKHRLAAVVGASRQLPRPLRSAATFVASRGPARARRAAAAVAIDDPAERLALMTGYLDSAARARLYCGPLAGANGTGTLAAVRSRLDGLPDDPLPATLHVDAQLALADDMLHYFDRASMAHSLEVRVPFLDHHLVEFAATIPGRLKVRRGRTTKFILKQAARGLVPDRIIDKPKIGFFNAAVDRWFASQAEGAIPKYLLADGGKHREFIDGSEVRALVERHRATQNSRDGRLLLSILMLEIWLSTFLPRALRSSTSATRNLV